ncbi:MAG: glutathione S-transferase [Siculibacillus sp.]|nr:glutathione S-transferase [Siculibacillus sp.]
MLTIWGRANSANVKKVLWIAEELGLPYERIDAGGPFGGLDTSEYRAMNPMGLVPVLQDGDLTLFESNVIVRYLAARYGVGSLWIDDPAARATAEIWMDWQHSFATPFRDVVFGILRTPPEKRDHAAIERGIAECARLWGIADAALAKTPWFSGARFGIGDVPAGCYAHTWLQLPIDRPDHPHLADWYARLRLRPAYAKVVATPPS